ncbi:MAG: hypothetical protein ED555_11940 [Allomuricauda sp.]|nr:MAG: hypothetical protein ED555_11940 [Allomuricauda sp.]
MHIYAHHADENDHHQDCESCEDAIYFQSIGFSTPVEIELNIVSHISEFKEINSYYETPRITAVSKNLYLVRPPPQHI